MKFTYVQVCIYALPLVSNWEDPVRSKLFGTNLWVESEEPILLRSNRKSLETPWWGHMAKYKRRVLTWEFPPSWMSKSTMIKGKQEIRRFWWFNWTYWTYTLKYHGNPFSDWIRIHPQIYRMTILTLENIPNIFFIQRRWPRTFR